MPQRIRDYAIAALALGVVFAALSGLDSRVPGRVTQALDDVASGRWARTGSPLANLMMDAASNPALDNFFVLALLAVGVVLVVLMVRT